MQAQPEAARLFLALMPDTLRFCLLPAKLRYRLNLRERAEMQLL